MTNTSTLINQSTPGIFMITLNKPDVHNAFDDVLITELLHHLHQAETDPSVHVVVLNSTGESFCSGGDLNWMKKAALYSQEKNLDDAMNFAELFNTLYHLKKMTVCAIHGSTRGGGVGFAACCDIVIAVPEAQFCFPEVKVGLIPAVISPYVIKAIGEHAAKYYFLTADTFDAAEALRLGLIHRIVDKPQLEKTTREIAESLLSHAPLGLAATKELIHKISGKPIDKHITHLTAEYLSTRRASFEGQEGINAFLEKRTPKWA